MEQNAKGLRRGLVFDIETVAAVTEENRAAVEPLARKREQSPEEYAGVCPPLARVACIAWHDTGGAGASVAYDATLAPQPGPASFQLDGLASGAVPVTCQMIACDGERALIERFAGAVKAHLEDGKGCLVSYNGRNFDLPVLIHRGIVNGAAKLDTFVRLMRENRYAPLRHIDLFEIVTFHGVASRWPLAAYAIGYGARSPKEEMDGTQVGDAVRAGRVLEVARYCINDVLATALLYEKCAPLIPAERK